LLLRTLRFPEIRTCETTDELGCVMVLILLLHHDVWEDQEAQQVSETKQKRIKF